MQIPGRKEIFHQLAVHAEGSNPKDVGLIVVGLSGGVDSSVSAWILKQLGFDVLGLFMKNWDDDSPHCTTAQDYDDVARVADQIGIDFYTVDLSKEYRARVFDHFLEEYKAGRTPNPDILCNREIKFDAFWKQAQAYGAKWLATGHYARRRGKQLFKGLDPGKDQSYFLYQAPIDALARTVFPIGGLEKSEVRKIAAAAGLATARKRDSTGICFIGERDFQPFLEQYLRSVPGDFVQLDGTKVGRHRGAQFYTLGQRKGLGLGGQGDRWFVVDKDLKSNRVYVERGEHPRMFSSSLVATEVVGDWPDTAPPEFRSTAKIRYRQSDQACRAWLDTTGLLHVEFKEPQRSISPGQSVVLYENDICLGGGVIQQSGPTLDTL